MSDPSVTVAEAFKQFSQVTVAALRAYEHGTRARLNQAEDDLRVLRHERDDSLRDLNAFKEQNRAWVVDVNRWKAEADSALLVHKHKDELIAQLRQEAQQWKDQCLRLEETLRGEIKAWKDQFLRVDAEHTRLLNQLSAASSSSSPIKLAAHTPKLVPILTGDSSATSSATKRCPSASASSSTVRADKLPTTTHSPTKALSTYPRVVRRVQAVINIPVKEEEEEDGDGNRVDWPDDSAAVLQPTSTPTGSASAGTSSRGGARGTSTRRRKSSASSHQRSKVVPPPPSDKTKRRSLADDDNVDDDVDDDDADDAEEEDDDGEEEPQTDGGDDGGEYVDEEEVEIAIASGTPAAAATGQKAIPWGRKHIGHEPDDEDDELMMYAKDNPYRVRLPHANRLPAQTPHHKSITDVTAQQRLSASKRRTTETGPGSSARTKRRR